MDRSYYENLVENLGEITVSPLAWVACKDLRTQFFSALTDEVDLFTIRHKKRRQAKHLIGTIEECVNSLLVIYDEERKNNIVKVDTDYFDEVDILAMDEEPVW